MRVASEVQRKFTLGGYRGVASTPLQLMTWEPFGWTLPALAYPRRNNHPHKALIPLAVINFLASRHALSTLSKNEQLIDDHGWVMRQTISSFIRYLAYPALIPRRTYWRGRADDVAFFIQVWGPVTLWGLSRGPLRGLAAGLGVGTAAHLGAAWTNGEPLIPPRAVRSRIANYTATSALVGVFVALVVKWLSEADAEIERARDEYDRIVTAQAGERARFASTELRRREFRGALVEIRRFIEASVPSTKSQPMLAALAQGFDTDFLPTQHTELAEALAAIGAASGIQVSTAVDVTSPFEKRQADFVYAVVQTAMDNIAEHAECEKAMIKVTTTGDRLELTIDDEGCGLPSGFALSSDHGLGKAAEYARFMGGDMSVRNRKTGGTEVRAWCPIK